MMYPKKNYQAAILFLFIFQFASLSQAQKTDDKTKKTEKESDRIDINKLEQKYWSAKDSDFTVVQNRTYTKAKRLNLAVAYGFPINDPYSDGNLTSFTSGWYFSERMGVELNYLQANLKDNDATKQFVADHAVYPNQNKLINSKTVSFSVVPFYAKMSFWDKKIIYFDMAFLFGLGTTTYDQVIENGNKRKTDPHYSFGIVQHFFFSNHYSVRLDINNKWTSEERSRYRIGASETEDDRGLGRKSVIDTSFMVGMTFWL